MFEEFNKKKEKKPKSQCKKEAIWGIIPSFESGKYNR